MTRNFVALLAVAAALSVGAPALAKDAGHHARTAHVTAYRQFRNAYSAIPVPSNDVVDVRNWPGTLGHAEP